MYFIIRTKQLFRNLSQKKGLHEQSTKSVVSAKAEIQTTAYEAFAEIILNSTEVASMSYAQLPVRGYRKWDDMGELYTRIIFPFCFDTRRQYNVKARPVYLKHRFIAWWDYNCKSATSNLQGWYAVYPLHIPDDEHFADGCIAYHVPSAVIPDTAINQ